MQATRFLIIIFLFIANTTFAQFCDTPVGFGRNATGGVGGNTYTVTNLSNSGAGSLRAALENNAPLIINFSVSGSINLNSDIYVKSNKTIDANGTYIRIRFNSFRIDNQQNIIIRNLHFDSDGVNHGGSGDAITIINGSKNIWVDHCSFEDYYDGLVDITQQSDSVTVSWCYFRGHDKVMLIGASDNSTADIGKLHVTVHHNYFDGTNQRHPRSRFGKIHFFNNWSKNLTSYGIASYMGAQTYVERNRFENINGNKHAQYQSPNGDGYIFPIGNQLIGGGSIPNTGGVFTPSSFYSYISETADNILRDFLLAYTGYNKTTGMSLSVSGNTMTANYLARSIQWYRNGILIGGATSNAYTAPNCGTYSVRLYGDQGCYKELFHTITTAQPAVPTITVLGGNAFFCSGGTVTLRSSVAPSGYSYQWSGNNTDISGATSRDYLVIQQGNYRVRLTGPCTTVNTPLTFIENIGTPDCNGVCGAVATLDCNGVCNGTASLDDCNICSGGNTGLVPNATKDCNGVCGGTGVLDCAGVCRGISVADCAGICAGTTIVDCAGICGGSTTADCAGGCSGIVEDCNGLCGGTAIIDCNGVCGGTAVLDCNGDCNGTAFLDDCGTCSGGNTVVLPNANKDCAGNCFGTSVLDCNNDCGGVATVDNCGICSGGNSGNVADSDKDCAGNCFGNDIIDDCGSCFDTNDPDFNLLCMGCDDIVNSGFEYDTCGKCLHRADVLFNDCDITHIYASPELRNGITLYPNPFTNEISICQMKNENLSFSIYNIVGETIVVGKLQPSCTTIMLNDIASGIYFYRLTGSSSNNSYSGRIIKQ